MKKVLLLFILSFTIFPSIFSQGLQFATDDQLEGVEIWINEERGFSDDLPSSFSLEEYCPPILTQNGSSCVGWSVCYSSMSIMYNYMLGITDPFQKYALAFDPYFMYSSLKNSYDFECEEGLLMHKAMDFIMDRGIKRQSMVPYLSCNSEWTQDWWNYSKKYSLPFAIQNYYSTPSIDNNTVAQVKYRLTVTQPVMIGVSIDESINPLGLKGGTVGSNGLWSVELGDVIGGHAMTIIAYDDYKFGGAFKVMNSWGREYGDNGFIWLTYKDFTKVVKEAYYILPKFIESENIITTINTSDYGIFDVGDGDSYEGMYRDGKRNGQGYYMWSNGDIYFGGFHNNVKDGRGILYDYSERTMTDFKYDEGVIVSNEERGFGSNEESEFSKFSKLLGSEITQAEVDPDFEVEEMLEVEITSNKSNFKKKGFNFNKTNNYNIKKTEIKESTTTDCPDCYGTLVTTYETEYCVGERCKNRTLYKCNYDSTHAYWIYHD